MIIYGKQILLEMIKRRPKAILEIYLAKEIDKKLFSTFASLGVPIRKVDTKKAQALARGGNHQGFLASIKEYETYNLADLKKENFLIVLYNITDVGNIGSIIRSAHALGCDGVIITEIQKPNFEAIARSSSGALFDAKVSCYLNAKDLLNELKMSGFVLYGADMNGQEYKDVCFEEKRVLVLGNESQGLGPKIVQKCDKIISIKMSCKFDSLNVSNAAAILIERMRTV